MKESEPYSWNKLIDDFYDGDELPLYEVLEFIITKHRFFRGKSPDEIRSSFGHDPEEFLHMLFEKKILPENLFDVWKQQSLPDSTINQFIRRHILTTIVDASRRVKGKYEEIPDNIEKEWLLCVDMQVILESAEKKLNERQRFVLYNDKNCAGGGDMTNKKIAEIWKCDDSTIENDVRKIKGVLRDEILPYLPQKVFRKYTESL